jgi:hypothetical protein
MDGQPAATDFGRPKKAREGGRSCSGFSLTQRWLPLAPDVYAIDRYDASQKLGEEVRASGRAGLLYDGLRRRTGSNVVAHRPRNITEIVQTDHFEITVQATSRMIDVRKLSVWWNNSPVCTESLIRVADVILIA